MKLNLLLIFILLFSAKTFAWETTYDIQVPGTNPGPSRGDRVFNYLFFSPALVLSQNEKMLQDNNNNVKPVDVIPVDNSSEPKER